MAAVALAYERAGLDVGLRVAREFVPDEEALSLRNMSLMMLAHTRDGKEEARQMWAELFPERSDESGRTKNE